MSTAPILAAPSATFFAPSAVIKSATMPCASPCRDSAATASFTAFSLRPLTITRAPSATSASAIARPMPSVEPVTRASFPFSFKSIQLTSLRSRPILVLLAQFCFQHLAGRGAGNLGHELERIGQPELRELRREVRAQLVLGRRLPRLQHDDRQRPLSPLRVRHCDDGCFRHLGMS